MKEKFHSKNKPNLEVQKPDKALNLDEIQKYRTEANEKLANTEVAEAIRELKSKAISVWGKIKNFGFKSKSSKKLPEIPDFDYTMETTTELDIEAYRVELQKINDALKNPSNSKIVKDKLFTSQRELYLLIDQINTRIRAESKENNIEEGHIPTPIKIEVNPNKKFEYANINNATKFDKIISKYSEYKNKLQNLLKINKPTETLKTTSTAESSDKKLSESLQQRQDQINSEMFASESDLNNITSFKRSKDPFRYANPKQGGIPMKRQKTAGSAN